MEVVGLEGSIDHSPGGTGILHLAGEIDMATVDELTTWVRKLAANDSDHVLIDMSGVTFSDSTCINVLVEEKKAIRDRGGRIVLVPSPPVKRLFDLGFGGQVHAIGAETVAEGLAILESGETAPIDAG